MRRFTVSSIAICVFAFLVGLFSGSGARGQKSFSGATIKASVGLRATGSPLSAGTLTLSRGGASFESSDYVFDVPVDDILAVEYHGARQDFLTLVLDSHAKFLTGYRPLVSNRLSVLNQQESLLIFQLDARESVASDVKVAASFEAFLKDARAARERAVVGVSGIDPVVAAADPSLGKTVHAVLKNNSGLLTFFPDRLQFDSTDARIVIPLAEVQKIEPAGARETYLTVTLPGQTVAGNGLATKYQKYLACCNAFLYFQFALSPDEPIAPAFHMAEDFQQYASTLRVRREQAIVNGPAQPSSSSANSSEHAVRKELGRYSAAFLEHHNPSSKFLNSLKVIQGIPGTIVEFDSGIGYVSAKTDPPVKGQRKAFLQNGYLKFLIPATAISSAGDVSILMNTSGGGNRSNSYIAGIDIDRSSPFFEQTRP